MKTQTYDEVLFDVQDGERFRRKMRTLLGLASVSIVITHASMLYVIAI